MLEREKNISLSQTSIQTGQVLLSSPFKAPLSSYTMLSEEHEQPNLYSWDVERKGQAGNTGNNTEMV